jgi:hypothetical protein
MKNTTNNIAGGNTDSEELFIAPVIPTRGKLDKMKKDDLINEMNVKFKTFKEITPEIVKNELDEYDNTLNIYKKSLELKIKNINELSRINDTIINLI